MKSTRWSRREFLGTSAAAGVMSLGSVPREREQATSAELEHRKLLIATISTRNCWVCARIWELMSISRDWAARGCLAKLWTP